MPREGETPLARLAQAVARGDGLSIGQPAMREDGVTAVLPVLRTRDNARGYVLAAEVPDQVSAVDPGRINWLRVRNDSGQRVFLPPASLFEGRETPSRGTTAGIFLDPRSEADVEVRCVHASQALSPSAVLHLAPSTAPDRVRRALASRDQGLVWAAVSEVVGILGGSEAPDDLLRSLAISDRGPRRSSGGPFRAPSDENICGAFVLDTEGVVAVEIFDSPESWRVASSAVTNGALLRVPTMRASPLAVTLEPQRALVAAREFLVGLGQAGYRRVAANSWTSLDGSSACAALDGEIVYLVVFSRRDSWVQRSAAASDARMEGMSSATGFSGGASTLPSTMATPVGGDGGAAVAETTVIDLDDVPEPDEPTGRPIRRKVLTSGWDAATFEILERYSRKEFCGDRSAAMRSLVRQGLRRRGYFGPRPAARMVAPVTAHEPEDDIPCVEVEHARVEARIRDFERIAQTDSYAEWLRKRARLELERMATTLQDETLHEAARSAVGRLSPLESAPEIPGPAGIEVHPPPPPLDVRPLLRRAFSASAGGQFSDALRLFDDVLDAEPDNRTGLLGRAVALRRSGKAQEALAALDLVLRLEPNNAAALLIRGRVLQERGDFRGALDTFDRLAAVAPNDWDVWMARGEVLARMGQEREALGAFSEALRRNPDDETIQVRIRTLEKARPPSTPATLTAASLPRDVQEGQSYLVKEGHPELSLRVFRTLAGRNVPCLLITRGSAERRREDPGLAGVRILILNREPGEGRISPDSLAVLTRSVERFLEENHGRGVVLLDSLRPLILENGFRDTVLFVERIHELILQSPAIFLISVAPGDLADREAALLERNLRVLT